jgi:hypothetical protein
MCTHYSITTNQEAIKTLFRVTHGSAGNLLSMKPLPDERLVEIMRGAKTEDRTS